MKLQPDDTGRERLNKISGQIAGIRASEAKENAKKQSVAAEKENMSDGAMAGAEMISLLIAGFLVGWGLDSLFDTGPFFLILFVLTGIGLGFYAVYRITTKDAGKQATPELQKGEKDATKRPEEQVNDL